MPIKELAVLFFVLLITAFISNIFIDSIKDDEDDEDGMKNKEVINESNIV